MTKTVKKAAAKTVATKAVKKAAAAPAKKAAAAPAKRTAKAAPAPAAKRGAKAAPAAAPAKKAKAAEQSPAVALLHLLLGGVATAIANDPKLAEIAESKYGLTLCGVDGEEEEEAEEEAEEEEELEEEFEEEEEGEEEEEEGEEDEALTVDEIIEGLTNGDADLFEQIATSEDDDLIREIAVTAGIATAKAARKTDAADLLEQIAEHFEFETEEGEEEEEEGEEMTRAEMIKYLVDNGIATKAKASKMADEDLAEAVSAHQEEEEEEEEGEEEEEEFEEEEEEFEDFED